MAMSPEAGSGLPDEQRAEAGIRIIVPLHWPAGVRMTVNASSAEHIPGRARLEPEICDGADAEPACSAYVSQLRWQAGFCGRRP